MATHMRDNLVIDALVQAAPCKNHSGSRPHLPYNSRTFQKALEHHGITQSLSHPNNPYDNAVAESLSKTLKTELIKGQTYEDQEKANQEISKYIEFY